MPERETQIPELKSEATSEVMSEQAVEDIKDFINLINDRLGWHLSPDQWLTPEMYKDNTDEGKNKLAEYSKNKLRTAWFTPIFIHCTLIIDLYGSKIKEEEIQFFNKISEIHSVLDEINIKLNNINSAIGDGAERKRLSDKLVSDKIKLIEETENLLEKMKRFFKIKLEKGEW